MYDDSRPCNHIGAGRNIDLSATNPDQNWLAKRSTPLKTHHP